MGSFQRSAHGVACLFLLLNACRLEAVGTEEACRDLLPGDLVITEIHANPRGADADDEYVELYNASGSAHLLGGVTLVTSRADGTRPRTHRFAGVIAVDPGDYLVAGNAAADALPPYVDYSYGSSLGSLRNADAAVSLWCGTSLIDEMRYERTVDGRALQLDGRLVPNHELNDDADNWCATPEGLDELSTGNFGTPGGPNSACETSSVEGTCRSGASVRAIVHPEPGRVHITEWMANPAGPDADFEWVEVAFDDEADLNGFQLGSAADALAIVIDDEACFPVDAGTRVVFGASPGAAPRVDAELSFSLGNSGLRSIVAGTEGSVLDRVDYEQTTEGIAWQVDSNANVCLARRADVYRADNSGTPGEANPSCPSVLSPGQCFDDGVPRNAVSPVVGQVHITEWMANPFLSSNREGEWVELKFDAAVDLNGLVLSDRTTSTTELQSERCLPVAAGTHLLLARSINPSVNGGIEDVDAELSLSLNNSDETITLSLEEQILDSVSYDRSKPGIATQVDEGGNVCDAVHSYGEGDLGTPGMANPPCS